ncbi:hypothetical protein [Pedobacter sp. P26]|uniref:hypothetical protein n=1 Tax=Pedobacter sp. P26 TaxID=3423956 RepID=UPI003D678542
MERFLKLMAIVFRFLVNKVGFVLLVGYVLAVYLGGVLKGARAFDVNSFKAFSSTGGLQDVLLDFVLLAMVCAFIYVLLSPKAFRKIFSPTVNMLGLILLAIIFFFTHPLALLILIGIALLIYILSLISGYGYVFELSGDSGPWKGRFMEEGENAPQRPAGKRWGNFGH